MKISFLIKYIGKTAIIAFAMVSLGQIAHMDSTSIKLVCAASCMYGAGSVWYQTDRRKKSHKFNSRSL